MDSTIHRFKNARIAVFIGDHPPVHVHLLGPGFTVMANMPPMTNEIRHTRFPHPNPLQQAGEGANKSLREFHVKRVD